eukprot:SAG31_NODE_8641_length_1415_cov_1.018237_2_plen_161_part_00
MLTERSAALGAQIRFLLAILVIGATPRSSQADGILERLGIISSGTGADSVQPGTTLSRKAIEVQHQNTVVRLERAQYQLKNLRKQDTDARKIGKGKGKQEAKARKDGNPTRYKDKLAKLMHEESELSREKTYWEHLLEEATASADGRATYRPFTRIEQEL